MVVDNGKKGLVLVTVLWVVVLLGIIVAVARQSSELDVKVSRLAGIEALRCKWGCRAGIETAAAVLNEDPPESDCLLDLWSDNTEDLNDILLEGCSFNVRVIDEASKLNVNAATKNHLLALPDMTDEIAGAIIDWRDNDERPSEGGVEGGYYENLRYGYRIRNGPFGTIRELLMVRGVTEEFLYGEDTNLNGELDYNERDGGERPPVDDGDDMLDNGWIAYLTCYSVDNNKNAEGDSRININKANERQLRRSLEIKRSHAKWIVDNRPKDGYKSIADLIDEKSSKKAEGDSKEGSDEAEPLDLATFSEIADKITVEEGRNVMPKVNVNTASKAVLYSLLGGNEKADALAENIIAYRNGLLFGMESIADVLNAESMKVANFKNIANYITVRSHIYTIVCVAKADRADQEGAAVRTEAVVDRSSAPYKILYWYQGATN